MCVDLRHGVTRRDALKRGAGAAAAFAGWPLPDTHGYDGLPARRHLDIALKAARWIEDSRIDTPHGVTWPADPADTTTVDTSLYTHSPGVVLFYVELYHQTGDSRFLAEAEAGADDLIARIPADGRMSAGLYTGLCGLAFVLEETYRASRRTRYREAAERCLDHVHRHAARLGEGVGWIYDGNPDSEVTDIVSGAAGIGSTLLYAHRRLGHERSLDLAAATGDRLIELARDPAPHPGRKWAMNATFGRLMPNFSHGTAGVAFFLAALHRATAERRYLDAAIQGARYLQSIATIDGDGYRIFHHEPEGEDLYYLGWCHGPVGTSRMFHQLAEATTDDEWAEWIHRGARGIMATGVPERRTPGFWNNVSQCGGNAGVGEFFLTLHAADPKPEYARYTSRIADDTLRRATMTADAARWVQSEHRVQPDLLVAQTGFMQGAAGIGTFFVHLDARDTAGASPVVWPDAGG